MGRYPPGESRCFARIIKSRSGALQFVQAHESLGRPEKLAQNIHCWMELNSLPFIIINAIIIIINNKQLIIIIIIVVFVVIMKRSNTLRREKVGNNEEISFKRNNIFLMFCDFCLRVDCEMGRHRHRLLAKKRPLKKVHF